MHPGCPYILSFLQTWAFQEKRGVMQWHSSPDSGWKQDVDASEDVQHHRCSVKRKLSVNSLLSFGLPFMTLPPQANPLVHPWNTSTAGNVWKIFSTPWSWLVKHVPRRCSWSSRSHQHWKLVGPSRDEALLSNCRYLEHKSSKQNSTSIRCLKVTCLETGLMLGSVGWRL